MSGGAGINTQEAIAGTAGMDVEMAVRQLLERGGADGVPQAETFVGKRGER
jgi:hypothetical protein